MAAYTGTPALPALLAGDIPNAATDWAAIVGALHGGTDAWTAWTPTWTNLTIGNGTVLARYRQVGKTVDFRLKFTLGTTSALTASGPTFTLPVAPHGGFVFDDLFGYGDALDAGIQAFIMTTRFNGGSAVILKITSTTPFTWGNGDSFSMAFTYEAA